MFPELAPTLAAQHETLMSQALQTTPLSFLRRVNVMTNQMPYIILAGCSDLAVCRRWNVGSCTVPRKIDLCDACITICINLLKLSPRSWIRSLLLLDRDFCVSWQKSLVFLHWRTTIEIDSEVQICLINILVVLQQSNKRQQEKCEGAPSINNPGSLSCHATGQTIRP